jgi:hypothetical protein
MTLLDRFRTQPREKHSDPAVRLAYVGEIPLDDRAQIAAIAREDEDARVRKAAVAKLLDPAVLGQIARDDADESVRGQATAMLRDIALEAFEGVAENDSLDAVDAIAGAASTGDVKLLAQIAKTAAREVVAVKALAALAGRSGAADLHMLGSIARHGMAEAARRGAFDLLRERNEHAEILAVAMNGEFKDTALAAAEIITGRDELEQIAARGKNKAAVKRARAVLREADEQAAREAAEAAATAAAGAALAVAVAPVVGVVGVVGVAPGLVVADPLPPSETAPTMVVDPEAERARAEAAAAEEQARAEAAERARAEREVQEVNAAERAAEQAAAKARAAEVREADLRARREALARLQHLLTRVEPLAAKAETTLKAADRALRDVRTALSSVPPLPARQDAEEIGRRLKAAQAALVQKVHELREAADWKQWANAGVQEQLCARMEALAALEDPEAIAVEVRELQQQWRQSADVPRARADALWRRFKAAHDVVWARCEAHFAVQAEERAQNLAKKAALCEKAESLSDSSSWIQTAEAIKALQAEWKTIGPVSRGREKAIWDRFRAACDRFFTRRHEDLAQRKAAWSENFAKKEALVVKAEALAASTEWDTAAAEIKRLQNEWKTIGPVKKSRSDAIWQRFRGACDAFFARYTQRHEVAQGERLAAREAICAELDALSGGENAEEAAPADLMTTVRALRGRWQQELASRGVEPARARELDDRFAAGFARVIARWPAVFGGTDLDPDANRKRMETLVARMEDLAKSLDGPAAGAAGEAALSPTTRLAAMLKEALAANTIGGKVDDDSRWRAAAEDVRQAQSSWSRIGVVPEAARRSLNDRFQRACRRISDRATVAGRPGGAGGVGR